MSTMLPPSSSAFDAPRPVLDVSGLPEHAFDWRSPVWWGNTLLIIIETTTIGLTLAAYFYIRRNYSVFPPPKVDVFPPIYHTEPLLKWGTINLILMLVSCVPMYITDVFARRLNRWAVVIGLIVMTLVAAACCYCRWEEFHSVYFWWNDNAYASAVWVLLATHVTYLLATLLEFALMGTYIALKGIDEPHALDVTLGGGYWYWAAAIYLIIYGVVYFAPRVM